ncbi:MAG: fumarate hydratase [Candidatus Fermentibacter sp.]|nr:fumarate hydratase [Candidatus Fermentibacter sp.]
MRELDAETIAMAVEGMCREGSTSPAPGLAPALADALAQCPPGPSREVLAICLENIDIASSSGLPLCQDTGVPVFLAELGSEVTIKGGTLETAIASGVSSACRAGFLRPSMVSDPFGCRLNTGDSTPPVVHLGIVEGSSLRLGLVLRGAGTENASRVAMLPPLSGADGVARFVVDTVASQGAFACPPLIVSVGVGGNLETCALLAKKGLLRPFGAGSPDPACAALEERLLNRINSLGIGPQGFGGPCTALSVRVTSAPCHMASLPVCVCMGCHALRTAEAML